MLNGQPALFIPASSAISMNLMGQMQIQMQGGSGNGGSLDQSAAVPNVNPIIEIPNQAAATSSGVDFSSLLANQLILPMIGENITNSQKSQNKET